MCQDFEFFIIPAQQYCYNCKLCHECAASSFLAGCDRWNEGPAYRKDTKEYVELLCDIFQAIKDKKVQMPPILDSNGYEYYTNLFLMAVEQ